jgi:biotin-(acetyl-CoA carboxylase) ligase
MTNFFDQIEKAFEALEREYAKSPEQRAAEAKAELEAAQARLNQRVEAPARQAKIQGAIGRQVRVRLDKNTVVTGKIVAVNEIVRGRHTAFEVTIEAPNGLSRRTLLLKSVPV